MPVAPAAHQRPPIAALTRALTSTPALVTALALTLISAYPFLWDEKMVAREFFDLQVYYGGVAHWLETGQLYNWALPPEEIYGFTYPPFAALVFTPFVLLTSADTAGPIFLLLNIAALVALVYLSCRGMGVGKRPALAAGLWLTPLLLKFFPISFNMELGQINLFLVLLILTDVIYLKNTRWHGVLIALTACIKLTPAIFGLLFIATRDWKSLARFVGTGLASILLSFAVNFEVAREYFTEKIFESSRVGSITGALNYNLLGTWAMLFPSWLTGVLFAVTALGSVVLTYLAVRRLTGQDVRGAYLGAASCVAVLGLLLSPHLLDPPLGLVRHILGFRGPLRLAHRAHRLPLPSQHRRARLCHALCGLVWRARLGRKRVARAPGSPPCSAGCLGGRLPDSRG